MFVTKALCIQFPPVWILSKYQKCRCWTARPRLSGWGRAFAPEGMDNIITVEQIPHGQGDCVQKK